MKKAILALITGMVFASGMFVGSISTANAVGTGGAPDNAIVKQLNAVAKILARADSRLDQVLGQVGPPEQPPEIVNALNSIKATCNNIITKVDLKLTGP